MNGRNNEAMSTEDFLRQVVFNNGGRGGEMRFRQVARPFAEQAGAADGEYGQRAPSGGGPERGPASAEARGRGAGNMPALFRIRCRTNNRGKLTAKEEGVPGNVRSWEYAFAPKGHLMKALCNGRVEEEYAYNEAGQRVRDSLRHLGRERRFRYNRQGQLVEVDGVRYYYAGDGSLRCKEEGRRSTYYEYGKDTRLDAARLPSGDTITYEYGNSLLPERILWDGRPVAAYQWQGPLQLARFRDLQTDTVYTFHYEGGRLPAAVTVAGEMTRSLVQGTGTGTGGMALSLAWGQAQPGGTPGGAVTLRLGTDQVGSVRTLSAGNGILIKEIAYDSFGNVIRDTLPRFFFPLGFAGGLTDPHTGFIRFGFRDYDPVTGRFTAKDPLGDTGGDHDLYDYCVDDPVSFVDPEGLEAQGIAGQGWNEALHPRTPDGRFTFKGEGNYGNQSQRPGAVVQDAPSLPLPSPQPLPALAVQTKLQPSTLHILPEWANDPGSSKGCAQGGQSQTRMLLMRFQGSLPLSRSKGAGLLKILMAVMRLKGGPAGKGTESHRPQSLKGLWAFFIHIPILPRKTTLPNRARQISTIQKMSPSFLVSLKPMRGIFSYRIHRSRSAMKKCLLCVVLFTIVAINLFPASFACAEQGIENMQENKNLDMMTGAEHIIQLYALEHYGWERGEYAIQFESAESQGKMLHFLVFHKDDEYPTSLGGGKSFLVIYDTEIRQVVKEIRFQ